MKVQLLNYTPLQVCANAIRTCWQSFDKSDSTNDICGEADKALIDRVGNQFKHASTLEHLNYNFYISGISRACLQELARHRMASLSVKYCSASVFAIVNSWLAVASIASTFSLLNGLSPSELPKLANASVTFFSTLSNFSSDAFAFSISLSTVSFALI